MKRRCVDETCREAVRDVADFARRAPGAIARCDIGGGQTPEGTAGGVVRKIGTVVTGCEGRIDVEILDPAGQPYIGPVGGQTEDGERGRLIANNQRTEILLFIISYGVVPER